MTTTLDVPGATLSYDTAGSGPLLLLFPGGAMDSQPFAGLQAADQLPPDLVSDFDVFYRYVFDDIRAFRADIETLRSRPVVIGIGEASTQSAERAAHELARLLGRQPVSFVGEHVGFAEDPEQLAKQLEPLPRDGTASS